METLWFMIVALMITAYAVLDGFDLEAGGILLFAANNEEERRRMLRAIGPVWDGNEVWLLAAGGTLYFTFPRLYASSFSGFYLPLMMVLWLLIMRGIGIEFRAHIENPVWQGLFDFGFWFSSALLAIFFGAALGNVIRGVPLGSDGYFFAPLWTNFKLGPYPGILDWYTVMAGLVAAVTLIVHGALYIAIKTEGALSRRARSIAVLAWPAQFFLTCFSLAATYFIRPQIADNYVAYPVGFVIPIAVFVSLAVMIWAAPTGREKTAFLGSTVYIVAMLAGAAFGLYPTLLPASTDPSYSLTIYNSAAATQGLRVGFAWWVPGMVLAIGYFAFVYHAFRGKVGLEGGGH